MQITDAQIHLWTNDKAPPHHWRAPFSIETAIKQMDEAGVSAALNHPPGWDGGANDYAAQAATLHPDKFATLDWFPLDKVPDENAVFETMQKPGVLGLRFVMAQPDLAIGFGNGDFDWLWALAEAEEIPVGLFVAAPQLAVLEDIASKFPRMRLLIDHLAILPFAKLPDAVEHIDILNKLAKFPNIAVKASGFPSMAIDDYPFASTHEILRKSFDAFGANRFFWGTDITRLHCSWRQSVDVFVDELGWLQGNDLELVMGKGLRQWIGWE